MKHGDGASIVSADNSKNYIFDGNYRNDKKHGNGQLII